MSNAIREKKSGRWLGRRSMQGFGANAALAAIKFRGSKNGPQQQLGVHFLAIPKFLLQAKPQNPGIAVRAQPVAPAYGKTVNVAKVFPRLRNPYPLTLIKL